MPTLSISDGKGHLDRGAVETILAVSLYPRDRDEERRSLWLSALRALQARDCDESGGSLDWLDSLVSTRDLAHLGGASESSESLFDNGLRREPRAKMAGLILEFRLRCVVHHPRYFELGLSVVRAALSEWHGGANTVNGDRVPAGDSSLRHAWPDFKPAAHLWAAWWPFDKQDKDQIWLNDPERVLEFLALSDSFAREAERHEILSASETWHVPEDLTLPEVNLSIQPLSESALEKLAEIQP